LRALAKARFKMFAETLGWPADEKIDDKNGAEAKQG
jgi:hypothetical protein